MNDKRRCIYCGAKPPTGRIIQQRELDCPSGGPHVFLIGGRPLLDVHPTDQAHSPRARTNVRSTTASRP